MSLHFETPKWEVNGTAIDADFEDYEFMKRYCYGVEVMQKREKEIKKDGSAVEIIKNQCEIYFEFFDSLFGEEAAKEIFKGKKNIKHCELAFENLIQYIAKQGKEARERRNGFTQSKNRAEKRNKNHIKNHTNYES